MRFPSYPHKVKIPARLNALRLLTKPSLFFFKLSMDYSSVRSPDLLVDRGHPLFPQSWRSSHYRVYACVSGFLPQPPYTCTLLWALWGQKLISLIHRALLTYYHREYFFFSSFSFPTACILVAFVPPLDILFSSHTSFPFHPTSLPGFLRGLSWKGSEFLETSEKNLRNGTA